ncbi:unnamed protein product [Schistocephalus solidus]|uniref:Uncharacterized protein n=1 Tax=Schistocephalus solidus TaxID=70667 RepID=A0A183SCX9_SCHSO|nr:unnamed protein product [Schistocephalus solidus]
MCTARKSGGVVFEVETATGIMTRRVNQLRWMFTTDGQIALHLLCDTFEVPTPNKDTRPTQPAIHKRHRKTQLPKKRIMDPKKKRYEVHLSKAVGVMETGTAIESWPKVKMAIDDARQNRPGRLGKTRKKPGNQAVCAAVPNTREALTPACGPNFREVLTRGFQRDMRPINVNHFAGQKVPERSPLLSRHWRERSRTPRIQ